MKIKTVVKYNVEIDEDELTAIYSLINAKINNGEECSSTILKIYDVIRPLSNKI